MKWGLAIIGLLLLGLFLKLYLLVYAMYALGGVLCLSRFFTRNWVENLAARRSSNAGVVEIGETVRVEVTIENTGHLTVPWLLIEDALPRETLTRVTPRFQAEGPRLALTRLAPGESAALIDYEVKFLARGYYQLGPLLMETGDVFGLHRRFRVAAEPHFAMVLPKVLPLEGYNLASRRPVGEIRIMHRLFEDSTRLAGIRPYQQGDPLNRIHWRATARTGELHSRVFENSCVAGATILLDFHVDSYSGSTGEVSAELAIMAAAALANAVFLLGQQVGFVSNGRDAADRIREEGWTAEFLSRADAVRQAVTKPENDRLRPLVVETGKGRDRLQCILETLARLEYTDGFDFPTMIRAVASRIPRNATVVAILRRVTPEIAAALGDLTRQGFLVNAIVVAFGGEAVPDWAKPPDWAEMLLSQGMDFHMVTDEESITQLCAQAIVR